MCIDDGDERGKSLRGLQEERYDMTLNLDVLLHAANSMGLHKAKEKQSRLFATHGPALVAALKAYMKPGHHIGCGISYADNSPSCDCGHDEAKVLLAKLDQEVQP